jgi:periplasmic protein TonB
VHALAVLAIMSFAMRLPHAAPPIRISLLPPPPPPAAAAGSAPESVSASAAVPQPKPVVQEAPVKPKPVVRPRKRVVPAQPQPAPEPMRAQPGPEIAPPLADTAALGGAGVPGGVEGGVPGGTVGGMGAGPVSADELHIQPVPISKVLPQYPPLARMRGIEGQVLLEATLAADGHIEPDITVLQSIPLLDNAAIVAVRQWRFKPVRDRGGAPVRVCFRVPVRFVLR